MGLLQFFTNLAQLLTSIQIPAGISALMIGGLLGAFKMVYWSHIAEVLGALLVVFAAANIIQTLYG